MVNYNSRSLNFTFAALSDPIRRAILTRLSGGEASVKELAQPFSISLPAVLKHLNYLQRAGLVAGEKRGRVHTFQLMAAPLQEASEWIAAYRSFWEKQFDSLAKYLDSQIKEDSLWKQKKLTNKRSRSNATSTPPERKSTKRGRRPRS